jgi:hypothetical protein
MEMAETEHTDFAVRLIDLAELFEVRLGETRLPGGRVTWRPQLSAPEGPSTGHGVQAVQHIRLIPDRGNALVAGSVNAIERWCELRTWEHLSAVHGRRFRGRRLALDKVAYGVLLASLRAFFEEQGLKVRYAIDDEGLATGHVPLLENVPGWMVTLVLVESFALAVALGAIVLLLTLPR